MKDSVLASRFTSVYILCVFILIFKSDYENAYNFNRIEMRSNVVSDRLITIRMCKILLEHIIYV